MTILCWIFLGCAILTMIWICFEIGGPIAIFGIILLGACIVFVGKVVIGVISCLVDWFS